MQKCKTCGNQVCDCVLQDVDYLRAKIKKLNKTLPPATGGKDETLPPHEGYAKILGELMIDQTRRAAPRKPPDPNRVQPVAAAVVGDNSHLMEQAARLYLDDGMKIADITFGRGVFWRKVDYSKYDMSFSDLNTLPDANYDFAKLPYDDETYDVVVFDPPYNNSDSPYMDSRYKTAKVKDNKEIRKMYQDGMTEAKRILKAGGLMMVKCQDIVESLRPIRNSIYVWYYGIEILELDDVAQFLLAKTARGEFGGKQFQGKQRQPYHKPSILWVFRK